MPSAPLRYCASPGCPEKGSDGYCERHRTAVRRDHRRYATAYPGVNYGRKWRNARRDYLALHPFCVDCEAHGETTVADEVDHVVPHRGDSVLFWDQSNWSSLCKSCHSRKTAREVRLGGRVAT